VRIVNECEAEAIVALSDNPHHRRPKLVRLARMGEVFSPRRVYFIRVHSSVREDAASVILLTRSSADFLHEAARGLFHHGELL
jgi:hypothetical protein